MTGFMIFGGLVLMYLGFTGAVSKWVAARRVASGNDA